MNNRPAPPAVDPLHFCSSRDPWVVAACDDGGLIVCTKGDVICHSDRNHGRDDPADLALFPMIAAAPDMLRLLEWLNARGGLGFDVHDRINVVLGKSRAPILRDGFRDDVPGMSAYVRKEDRSNDDGTKTQSLLKQNLTSEPDQGEDMLGMRKGEG